MELVQTYAHVPVMLGYTTAECTGYITWLIFARKSSSYNISLSYIRQILDKNGFLELNDLKYVLPPKRFKHSSAIHYATYKYYVEKEFYKPKNDSKQLPDILTEVTIRYI